MSFRYQQIRHIECHRGNPGRRNSYPHKLGVIEEGAYTDILIVDGNPLEDLSLLGAPPSMFGEPPADIGSKTIPLIMKDGKIFKNTLE